MAKYKSSDVLLKYWKDYHFKCGDTYDSLIWKDERPKPTEEEIQAKIVELETAEPMRLLRIERDTRIAKTDWRATVDYPGTDQEAWLTYRQALRDLPATAEPELDENGMLTNVTWPEEPVSWQI